VSWTRQWYSDLNWIFNELLHAYLVGNIRIHLTIKLTMLKFLTLFLFLGMVVARESKSLTQPKAGSTFTYDQYYIDTTSGTPIAATRDTTTETIVQTGMSYLGKTNVSKVLTTTKHGIDTSYINYESNGDFSISAAALRKWFTMPCGSKSTSTTTTDTTMTYGSVSIKLKMVLTTSFASKETLSVKGHSMDVLKLKQYSVNTMTNSGSESTTIMDMSVYYSPSLGIIIKDGWPVSADPATGAKSPGRMNILIDYNLK